MPRIPDYTAAGTSVPRANTPRFAPDRSGEIVAEGQQALLGAVGAAVDQAVDHDDKLRYAAARSTLLDAQAEARKELEGDNNYETYEARFRERAAKARSIAAANIRGTRSRELFEADAQADIERGVDQIRGLARAREVDQGIATMNTLLESNRNKALETKDPIERGARVQASLDAIDGAYQKGYIKETEAVAQRERFKSNYGEAFVGIQSPAERIEMLSNPDTNVAKFIAPDRRKALLEAAKRENDEVRVRGESQAHFDGYVEKYGSDFKGAIRAAREELKADPLVRDATETRLRQEQVAAQQFERQDREEAGEEALEFILGGGKFGELPISLKNRLKPSALNSLRSLAESGGRTQSDAKTLQELSSLFADDPQAFGDLDLLTYTSKLTPADYKQWLDRQSAVRTGKLDGKDTGYQSIVQARDNKLRELFKATTGKGETQEKISAFTTKFEARLTAFKESTGKAARIEDARSILDDMAAEVVTKEGFFSDTKKRAYQLTEEDVAVPPKDRDQIIGALRRAGEPVTVKRIQDIYWKKRASMFEKPAAPTP